LTAHTPLLTPDTRRIGRPPGPAFPDRAPDSLAAGTPQPLRRELEALLGAERVLHRAIDLVRYASDASPYRLIPAVVVMAHDAGDVGKTIAYAREHGLAVNFRGGGTSLNGQAQTDAIMIDVRRWFSRVRVEDGGARVRLSGGTLLGLANKLLARHGFKLGPDPASKDIATIGGVIANNSGGMRCGVAWDSYSTVESLKLVLASGTVIDTAEPDAEQRFAAAEPELARGLLARSCLPTNSSPPVSGASTRSRTSPATGSARCSTPTRRLRSSAASSSAPRGRSRSSPRPSCARAPSPPARRSRGFTSRTSMPPPTLSPRSSPPAHARPS
jgi:hypothetical protein